MEKRIVLVSNIVFEPCWRPCMEASFATSKAGVQTICISYEELDGHLSLLGGADIVAVCLNFETLYPNVSNDVALGCISLDDVKQDAVDRCRRLYAQIKTSGHTRVVWFGFEDYSLRHDHLYGAVPTLNGVVDQINVAVSEIVKPDVYLDLKRIIAKVGVCNAFDDKGKYRWNAPYAKTLVAAMADEVYKQYLIHEGKTKKCLILDCDNVLWGGILSEDGMAGIQVSGSGLGRPFQDFQRFVLDMYHHGALLAVCSKNDEDDVLKVFDEHSGMLLKQEHIACFCCNWNDKPSNIQAISERLNIGLDSMVFVDDSLFELEAVRAILPEVTAIQYHRDTVYGELASCFHLRSDIDIKTIKRRADTYKTNGKREALKENAASLDEYIASLNMSIDIHPTQEYELARVSELTQRTNQCTNGVRYTLEQLKERLVMPDYELYTVCLSDRFSDLGIVGVMGICHQTIELFSLSCRALGRGIEDEMMRHALALNARNFRFFSTPKNEKLAVLFRSCDLTGISCSESCPKTGVLSQALSKSLPYIFYQNEK